MDAAGQTCKLCLKYIKDEEFITLDDKILDKLEFLQIDLDHSVEESNSVCTDCEEKIENAFDFKSHLVNSIESSGSADNEQNIPSTSTGETSAENTLCHLCKNSVDKLSVISLTKILKDDCMMGVFQGHIQEVDLKNLKENSMVCEMCQKSLASFSTLVSSWSIANDWNEDDTKDDIDDFEMVELKKENLNVDELSDSSINTFEASDSATNASETKKFKRKRGSSTNAAASGSSKKIKTEIDEISDSSESISIDSKDVKKEETEENNGAEEIEELQLKHEEIDIKDEDGLIKRSINHRVVPAEKSLGDKCRTKLFACNQCFYHTHRKHNFENHLIRHKCSDEVELFSCHDCGFSTKWKTALMRHAVVHKSFDTAKIYKCDQCCYITKQKYYLKSHQLKHKSFPEVEEYRCQECSYVTKYKNHFKAHQLVHLNIKESQSQYEEFSSETKFENDLNKHWLIHRSLGEVQLYKCNDCAYVSKYKASLKTHLLVHLNINEIRMYKCEKCCFKTKRRDGLKNHLLKHKSLDEAQVYRCNKCSFVTKYKQNLRDHLRLHSKEQIYKCEKCSFKTNHRRSLRRHLDRLHI